MNFNVSEVSNNGVETTTEDIRSCVKLKEDLLQDELSTALKSKG